MRLGTTASGAWKQLHSTFGINVPTSFGQTGTQPGHTPMQLRLNPHHKVHAPRLGTHTSYPSPFQCGVTLPDIAFPRCRRQKETKSPPSHTEEGSNLAENPTSSFQGSQVGKGVSGRKGKPENRGLLLPRFQAMHLLQPEENQTDQFSNRTPF